VLSHTNIVTSTQKRAVENISFSGKLSLHTIFLIGIHLIESAHKFSSIILNAYFCFISLNAGSSTWECLYSVAFEIEIENLWRDFR